MKLPSLPPRWAGERVGSLLTTITSLWRAAPASIFRRKLCPILLSSSRNKDSSNAPSHVTESCLPSPILPVRLRPHPLFSTCLLGGDLPTLVTEIESHDRLRRRAM